MRTVLHIAPHPDDESVGAPCALLDLAQSGAEVIVVACGLGRPADHDRRRRELVAATTTGGFELIVREPPGDLGSTDDLAAEQRALVPWLIEIIDKHDADLVIGPQLHDVHPAHETVARAIRDAITSARNPPVWWSWGIWADLSVPTLLFPCSRSLINDAMTMLSCYDGELARNNYVSMVLSAGKLAAVKGVERVLGFGSAALVDVDHAELFTELGWNGLQWRFGVPRVSRTLELPDQWGHPADEFMNSVSHANRFWVIRPDVDPA